MIKKIMKENTKRNHNQKRIYQILLLFIISLLLMACKKDNKGVSNNGEYNVEITSGVGNTDQDLKTQDDIINTTEEIVVDDMEIIKREGHPKYYGSIKQSHEVWNDVPKTKIHFADGSYGYNDKPILSMSGDERTDIIKSIIINFENFENNPEIELDEIIPMIAEYMPYDIMDKWYVYSSSKAVVPDNIEDGKESIYHIAYRLTDEAKKSKEHNYSGSIDVMINVKNDTVKSVNFTYGQPKWMLYPEQNGYHYDEWKCDLYDYR